VWVTDHSEIRGRQPSERARAAVEAAIRERKELPVGEYSARTLCSGCSAYLAKLDEAAIPLLSPMIEGGAAVYQPEQQRLLAGWGARAAYAILAVERKAVGVPKSHRRLLRDGGEPHANVFVGYGRYRANHIGVIAARLLVSLGDKGAEAEPDVEAYSVLAVFGHMVLRVFGVRRRAERTRVRTAQGRLVRVWPPRGDVASWPPLWGLSEHTLEGVFLHQPFYEPFRYSEVRYRGPNVRIPVWYRRTEGLRGRG
jgi:hypothetical protein